VFVKLAANLLGLFEPRLIEDIVLDFPTVRALHAANGDLDAAAADLLDTKLIKDRRVLYSVPEGIGSLFDSRHALIRQPLSDR